MAKLQNYKIKFSLTTLKKESYIYSCKPRQNKFWVKKELCITPFRYMYKNQKFMSSSYCVISFKQSHTY